MDKTMSQRTRKEILERMRRRYRNAGPEHKRKLLDQAQELLGYHRKSAVRALRAPPFERAGWINTGRPVSYEPKVLLPWLRPIWQATDYACGRRLVAMLPEWLPARSEEHTSELQSRPHLVCRLLLEKKKNSRAPTSRQFSSSGARCASTTPLLL